MFYGIFNSPLFPIIAAGDEKGLSCLHLQTKSGEELELSKEWIRHDDFFTDTFKQLDEYFSGKRKMFDMKLNPQGTQFQKKVWNALTKIPYGEVCSYKDIAIAVGNEKACRAVGMANSKNPIAIVVPCHRVIGSSGKLVGYAGGLDTKDELLKLEKRYNR
ncbi:methylated-DNA--[protein]-cysteine S-methyltransferase [Vallitalea guaymasensis]|uniref:Methylated-DNA--protein-cysteine methyltransferase n=1 Tax=Vallitalea guaymasensis TaxID=1185412 RepID=A0A8J8MBL7_9FIRM|nr:methylated-DNA--[protein]-cysteine S-methyltransferase [Vallitalea guaymasensis]QUH29913.1 methylated-DNA--[protein]-cysteine S-methyltransferase [Vallitalea guaymasensis]